MAMDRKPVTGASALRIPVVQDFIRKPHPRSGFAPIKKLPRRHRRGTGPACVRHKARVRTPPGKSVAQWHCHQRCPSFICRANPSGSCVLVVVRRNTACLFDIGGSVGKLEGALRGALGTRVCTHDSTRKNTVDSRRNAGLLREIPARAHRAPAQARACIATRLARTQYTLSKGYRRYCREVKVVRKIFFRGMANALPCRPPIKLTAAPTTPATWSPRPRPAFAPAATTGWRWPCRGRCRGLRCRRVRG